MNPGGGDSEESRLISSERAAGLFRCASTIEMPQLRGESHGIGLSAFIVGFHGRYLSTTNASGAFVVAAKDFPRN